MNPCRSIASRPWIEPWGRCRRDGFLTGSIDLVFQDPQHQRWWVLDWKSNWIGERRTGAEPGLCGPHHYSQEAMEEQMLHHHYPLQAHLYLVALHRHLRWRLPDYDPEQHLGATSTASFGGCLEL